MYNVVWFMTKSTHFYVINFFFKEKSRNLMPTKINDSKLYIYKSILALFSYIYDKYFAFY